MISQSLRYIWAFIYAVIILSGLLLAGYGLLFEKMPSELASQIGLWVFLIHLASTFFLCGLIWTVQIVNYPLFADVGVETFGGYHQAHLWRMTTVVAIPMILELVTGCLLFLFQPFPIAIFFLVVGVLLIFIVWLSTIFLQVPRHESLSQGYTDVAQRLLTVSNWIRTVAWSLRGMLLLWILCRELS